MKPKRRKRYKSYDRAEFKGETYDSVSFYSSELFAYLDVLAKHDIDTIDWGCCGYYDTSFYRVGR